MVSMALISDWSGHHKRLMSAGPCVNPVAGDAAERVKIHTKASLQRSHAPPGREFTVVAGRRAAGSPTQRFCERQSLPGPSHACSRWNKQRVAFSHHTENSRQLRPTTANVENVSSWNYTHGVRVIVPLNVINSGWKSIFKRIIQAVSYESMASDNSGIIMSCSVSSERALHTSVLWEIGISHVRLVVCCKYVIF